MTIPVLTEDQQTSSLAGYMPSGRPFLNVHTEGTVMRSLMQGLSGEFLRVDASLALFRSDILPDETIAFLSEWESAVGIPDDCFPGTGTDDDRRRDILAKLVSLGVQTSADFVQLAGHFGFVVTVDPGITQYPGPLFSTAKEARFSIIVTFSGVDESVFPYTFPFTFGDSVVNIVQCLFNKLKPANVDVIYVFT